MERENFLPALWEFCRLPPTKRLFAAPWTLELRALHVRRGAPARAGLALADLSEWKGVETVLSLGARARARAAGNAWEGESLLSGLAPWVWTAGGSFLSEDGRHPTFLSPEALQGAALFRNLLLDGPSAGLWSAPLGSVREPGVSPIPSPRGPAGRFSCLGGQVLAMAAGTRHSEESWALFRHLLSPAAQLDYARAAGMLPPRLPGAAELLEGPELGLFQDELSRARTLPSDVLLGSFERLLQRRLAVPAREAAPWADWQAALDDAAAESEMLLSLYEPAAV
jgi:ABC-type glycerol-3-phosphate transport system substrate-binding protein